MSDTLLSLFPTTADEEERLDNEDLAAPPAILEFAIEGLPTSPSSKPSVTYMSKKQKQLQEKAERKIQRSKTKNTEMSTKEGDLDISEFLDDESNGLAKKDADVGGSQESVDMDRVTPKSSKHSPEEEADEMDVGEHSSAPGKKSSSSGTKGGASTSKQPSKRKPAKKEETGESDDKEPAKKSTAAKTASSKMDTSSTNAEGKKAPVSKKSSTTKPSKPKKEEKNDSASKEEAKNDEAVPMDADVHKDNDEKEKTKKPTKSKAKPETKKNTEQKTKPKADKEKGDSAEASKQKKGKKTKADDSAKAEDGEAEHDSEKATEEKASPSSESKKGVKRKGTGPSPQKSKKAKSSHGDDDKEAKEKNKKDTKEKGTEDENDDNGAGGDDEIPTRVIAVSSTQEFHRGALNTLVQQKAFRDCLLSDKPYLENNVTHLILGEEKKRTVKVLTAIARGLWVLKPGWIFKCGEEKSWQPEDEFEASDWFPGAKISREKHEKGEPLLFDGLTFCISGKTTIPKDTLVALIEESGGSTVGVHTAKYIIVGKDAVLPEDSEEDKEGGDSTEQSKRIFVSEEFVKDALEAYKLPNPADYKPSK